MNSKECYELLGIQNGYDGDDFEQVVETAFARRITEENNKKENGEITVDEFYDIYDKLVAAKNTLINSKKKTGTTVVVKPTPTGSSEVEKQTGAKGSKKTTSINNTKKNRKGVKTAVACVVVAAAIGIAGIGGYHLANRNTKDDALNNKVTIETTQTTETNPAEETIIEETTPVVRNYGDVQDAKLIEERANVLISDLNAAKVVNPVTNVPYTLEEITQLIQYANGVYTPSSIEEIDILHLNLLNLLISPLNTEPYLYHVVYANGNDEFKDIAIEQSKNIKPINFASAFAEYGENGVYPLTLWMQQRREEIYSTTNRDEINRIYVEVGQVMADIMKGNGCTITILEDGKKVTYNFTSEEILANHASAMLLTIDAQLIFANRYEIRDENNKVIDSVQTEWQVYNKYNSPDKNETDTVTLEEIEAWINNGCDYEWQIDDVLIGGQTFGQRIQGDMEGMALNNYTMTSDNKTLTK